MYNWKDTERKFVIIKYTIALILTYNWKDIRHFLNRKLSTRQNKIFNCNHSEVVFKYIGGLLQRALQPSLISHFLSSCISFQFSPLISTSFLIWSIHLVLGWFLSIFVCSIFLGSLSSLIRIICPNHLNFFFIHR